MKKTHTHIFMKKYTLVKNQQWKSMAFESTFLAPLTLSSPSPQWVWDSDCRPVQPRHRASSPHRYQSERCLPGKVILTPVLKLNSRWVQPRNGRPSFYPDPIHERGSTLGATSQRIFLALIALWLVVWCFHTGKSEFREDQKLLPSFHLQPSS